MRASTFAVLALLLVGVLLALIFRGAPPVAPPLPRTPSSPPQVAVSPPVVPAKELNFCSDSWPPYTDKAGSGREGYVVELIRAIYEPLGYRVNYTVQPWSRCLTGARSGRFVGLAGSEHNDAPDMVFPRQMAGGSVPTFYTLPKSRWIYGGEASLRQVRLGVVQSYTYAPGIDRYLETEQQSAKIIVFRGDEPLRQMLSALQGERIDAFIENSVVVAAFLRQQQLPVELLRVAGTAGPAKGVFVPFTPLDERSYELAALFDRRLGELRGNGGLQKILERYNVSDWNDTVTGRGY